jgi:hypothetical protein
MTPRYAIVFLNYLLIFNYFSLLHFIWPLMVCWNIIFKNKFLFFRKKSHAFLVFGGDSALCNYNSALCNIARSQVFTFKLRRRFFSSVAELHNLYAALVQIKIFRRSRSRIALRLRLWRIRLRQWYWTWLGIEKWHKMWQFITYSVHNIFSNINRTESNKQDSFIMCLNFYFVLNILHCCIVG